MTILPESSARPVFGASIITKFLSPGNVKGSRVSVKGPTKTRVFSWDQGAGPDANHTRAALAYAKEMSQGDKDSVWAGPMLSSHMPDGSRVHVFQAPLESDHRPTIHQVVEA